MKYTGTLRPDQLPGYRGKKVRFQKQVGEAMKNIIELPGAKQAIERRLDGEMYVSRLTVKSSKKAEREERYRHRRDSYREMAARERIGLKPSS